MQLSVGELIARFLMGAAYMGAFVLFTFVALHLWDLHQDNKRKKVLGFDDRI